MKARPGRPTRGPDGRESGGTAESDGATGRTPRTVLLDTVGSRLVAAEPILAPVCALILLLAPNPLIWPAAIVGVLPSAARLVLTGRPWRPTHFDVPLVLLGIGALLGGWASLSGEGTLIRLTGILAGFLLFAAAREHMNRDRALRRLVPGLLMAAVVCALLMLVLVAPFLILDHIPPVAAAVSAIDRWQVGAWFVDQDWLLQRYRFRASGVGALGVMGLTLAYATMVVTGNWRARSLTALAIPVFLALLVVADNRGAMLAGALTLGAMATVWRRRLLPLIPVAGVLAVLFLAFGPIDRGLSLKTLAQRFWFWENSLYLAREVPFTGAGLGLESVQLVYRAYFLPSYPPFSHAHNIYLQGLLEYGVFGLLGLLGLGLATVYVGWRTPAAPDRRTMAGRLAGFGIAMALLTTGLSEIVMLSTFGSALGLAALGLLAATTSTVTRTAVPDDSQRQPAVARQRRVRFTIAAVIVGLLAAGFGLSPAGPKLAAQVLLNAGTADLNRGALSESITKDDRSTALDRAVWVLRLAGSFDPERVAIQRNLALALAANNDSRRGRAAADRAKALTSAENRADLLQLGRAYVAINAWGEAIRAWEAAGAAPQLIQLGNRLIRARNHDQAINAFTATAHVDPKSGGAYEGIVRAVREHDGTTDDAIEALGPLLERDTPTEYGARLQAARVYREAGRLRDAQAQLVRAEEIGSDADLSFELGRLMMAAGRPDHAEPLLVKPVDDLPNDPDNWLWLARARAALGQHERAVATIRDGLSKVDPSGTFAPPAVQLPETAAVRATEIKHSERAILLGVLGESLIRLGRADEALPALDEAVAAAPNDPWLATTRAEAAGVAAGASPNLVLNPAFQRTGSWALRTNEWWTRPLAQSLLNEEPSISDGAGRLASQDPAGRQLVQEVLNLEPGQRYRLAVHLRAEHLAGGAVRVSLGSLQTTREVVRLAQADEMTPWTTVTIEAEAGSGPDGNLTVVIGFTPETAPGAAITVDQVTLTRIDGGPSSTGADASGRDQP